MWVVWYVCCLNYVSHSNRKEQAVAKEIEWFIFIKDTDKKLFSLAGPVQGNLVDDWIDAVVREQEAGRELSCQEVTTEQLAECRTHALRNGLSETDSNQIITSPRDRSNDYLGKLPNYASKADRARVVQLLCKGKCGSVRWAEINKPYPGKDALRSSKMGEYKATCLRCGSTTQDNYNWYR